MVIDGESRLAAARQLGLASVPCIRVDHLNESEQRLLRLAVNRLGEKGSWDIAELEVEFKEHRSNCQGSAQTKSIRS
jgi:ParB-like chromosome segregation protein Spo0J